MTAGHRRSLLVRNWRNYRQTLTDADVRAMQMSLQDWLGTGELQGKGVVDIGSGSGLSATALWKQGVASLLTFDFDPHSVAATEKAAEDCGAPENWNNKHGSILDRDFVAELGSFDIVHSWGVLHHTGNMWEALENAIGLLSPGGRLLISLYAAGPRYPDHLELKQRFNQASDQVKESMIRQRLEPYLAEFDCQTIDELRSSRRERGMSIYYDVVDWLGGLPYEVAWSSEVLGFCGARGLEPCRVMQRGEGGCSEYLFQSVDHPVSLNATFEWRNDEGEQAMRNLDQQMRQDFHAAMSAFPGTRKPLLPKSIQSLLNRVRQLLGSSHQAQPVG